MSFVLSCVGILASVALVLAYRPLFVVRDRGRHDFDGAGPLPEVRRVWAVAAAGLLGGLATLGPAAPGPWPIASIVAGVVAAAGLSAGHLGGAGLAYGPIADRYLSWYGSRTWATYPALAASGVATTAWAAAWVALAGPWWAALPAIIGGAAKVVAYESAWRRHLARAGGDQAAAWADGVPLTAATRAGIAAAAGVGASLAIAHATNLF